MIEIPENPCYVALPDGYDFNTECVCDDDGIGYLCPTCGRRYDDDFDALFCCIEKAGGIRQKGDKNEV